MQDTKNIRHAKKYTQKFSFATAVSALIGAWLLTLIFMSLISGGESVVLTDFVSKMSHSTFLVIFLISAGALLGYGYIYPPVVYGSLPVITLIWCMMTAFNGRSYFLTFAMCGIIGIVLYAMSRKNFIPLSKIGDTSAMHGKETLSKGMCVIFITVVTVLLSCTAFVIVLTRYTTFTLPASSTSLYGQMLYNMREGIRQITTIEYGEMTSHFSFHISPILYLLLPFYVIIPSNITLVFVCFTALFSSVVPLSLIARKRGLSRGLTVFIALIFCLFPSLMTGLYSGIHEYAFLLPLLLWVAYAYESRRYKLMWLFTVLTLCVRETAAIYLFSFALYWFIDSKAWKNIRSAEKSYKSQAISILALLGISLVYFTCSMLMLEHIGLGTLIYRYQNISGVGGGFEGFFRAIIMNPAIIIYEIFSTEKLHFIFTLLLPTALLPILSRKRAALVFVIPLLIFNLMADYVYFYNFNYPYVLGITAIIFYLTVIALSENKHLTETPARRQTALSCLLCFTLIISSYRIADLGYLFEYSASDKCDSETAIIQDTLDLLPEDLDISASSHFCPHLTKRDTLYTLTQEVRTTCVVLDLREDWITSQDKKYNISYFEELGYTVTEKHDGIIAVLQKANIAANNN